MRDKAWRKYVAWFIFAVAIITVYKTIDSFGIVFSWFGALITLLMPFGLGIMLAYMLYYPCRKVEKVFEHTKPKFIRNRARKLSIITVYIIVIIFIVFLFKLIIPILTESIKDLAYSLPNYYNKVIEYLSSLPEDSILTKIDAVSYVKKLEEINISETIVKWLDFNNISKYIKGITNVAGVIFDIFITLIISFYALIERSDIKNFLKNLFKAICSKETYKRIARYYKETGHIFYKFISAQIFDAFVIGIITTIAMLIMKVKYATLLGFLIGLFNIIPYFGAIVAVRNIDNNYNFYRRTCKSIMACFSNYNFTANRCKYY